MKVNVGNDLYLKGRIGWKGLSKDEYLDKSDYRIINGYSLKDGYIDWDIAGYISEERYEESPEIKLEKNDILISKDGTIGKVGIVRNLVSPTTVASGIFVLRNIIADRLDTEYLFQYLKSSHFKAFINAVKASGSTIIHLYQRDLAKLEIDVPQLPIQKAISSILFSLDSKIELNNRINAALEAMAKTLYDYWFVQFDFPDANGKPYKTCGGKMVWNEELKREIPEGWEVKTFSEWINNDKSGDWGKEQIEGNYTEKVYCIRGADINGLNGTGELKSPERYILEKNLHKTLDPADLIVEISGGSPVQSTGRLAFITAGTLARFDAPIICSNFCKAVTLKDKKLLYNFVYHWKSIYDAGVLFGYEGKTSGIKNLLFDSFVSSHYTVVPEETIAEKFYDFMEPIQAKKQKNLKENQELASLRDWLLPMLMNGQVRVGDFEEELRMVAEERGNYGK